MKHDPGTYGMVAGAEKFPLMVIVSFSYVCNSKCPNCPYNNSDIRSKYKGAQFISEDVFKLIVAECSKHGSFLRITGGGEPTLHPKLVEFVSYAKECNARVGLITNGSALNDDKLYSLIVTANIDAIEFSVDASDKDTYTIVRKNLPWEKVHHNVLEAVHLRDKYKTDTKIIVSVIDQKEVDAVQVEKYWTKIVDNVQVRKYITWGYNEEGLGVNKTPFLKKRIPCPWPFERVSIDTKGNVTLCGHDIAFEHLAGNIKERSIEKIWRGPEFETFRTAHLEGKAEDYILCKKCADWPYRSWKYNYFNVLKNAKK